MHFGFELFRYTYFGRHDGLTVDDLLLFVCFLLAFLSLAIQLLTLFFFSKQRSLKLDQQFQK